MMREATPANFGCLLIMVMASMLDLSNAGQAISNGELYEKGNLRFIPKAIVTEDSMGGKCFFSLLYDFALDDKGNLYASDSKEGNIKKFDESGSFLGAIGSPGQGPGELNLPTEIEWSKGQLYVLEMMNRRFSIFGDDGRFIRSVPYDRTEGDLVKMKALPDGRIIIQKEKDNQLSSDANQEIHIELFSSNLEFVRTLYSHEVRLRKTLTQPRNHLIPIPFAPNVFWDILPSGQIVICYSGEYEIEVFDPDQGRISSFTHSYTPIKIEAEDKELYFAGLRGGAFTGGGFSSPRRGAPDHIVKNTEFPRYKTPIKELIVDKQGYIWVVPSRGIDDKILTIDVFESGGRFLRNITIDNTQTFPNRMVMFAQGFWAPVVKEDGVTLVKYVISN